MAQRTRCTGCSIPINDPGQDVMDEDALLCDTCYEEQERVQAQEKLVMKAEAIRDEKAGK